METWCFFPTKFHWKTNSLQFSGVLFVNDSQFEWALESLKLLRLHMTRTDRSKYRYWNVKIALHCIWLTYAIICWMASSIGDLPCSIPFHRKIQLNLALTNAFYVRIWFGLIGGRSACVCHVDPFSCYLHNVSISVEKSTFVIPEWILDFFVCNGSFNGIDLHLVYRHCFLSSCTTCPSFKLIYRISEMLEKWTKEN